MISLCAVVSLAFSLMWAGGTYGSFFDSKQSTDNALIPSNWWVQTTQSEFEAGVLSQVDTTTSPGDVGLATSTQSETDSFTSESQVASKTNVVVDSGAGQVKLAQNTATEILRPDGAGEVTKLPTVYPNKTNHWDAVNDETPDENATYVLGSGGKWGSYDLYSIANHTAGSGKINYVKVYIRCLGEAAGTQVSARVVIKTYSTEYRGNDQTVTASYADYAYQWDTNPNTGDAWIWSEIDALQAGVELRDAAGGKHTRCTQVYIEVSYTYYLSPGTLTSTNLLSGKSVVDITSFSYNASSIPSGTGLKVQFSQDNTSWYNSAGTSGGWDNCSQGSQTISLSSLGWSGANFYYRMQFTTSTDKTQTPVLDEIEVTYTQYYSSGTIASQVYDSQIAGAIWDELYWSESLNSGMDITFEIRASDTSFAKDSTALAWTNLGTAGSPVDLSATGKYFQWRATLTTSDMSLTPILHDVTVYYPSVT